MYALIVSIGGLMRPGENIPRYLARVAKTVGAGFSATRAGYYEDRAGKRTRTRFQQAAQNADHIDDAIAFATYHLELWKKTDPEFYRREIDAAREFIDRLGSRRGAVHNPHGHSDRASRHVDGEAA